MAHNQPRLKIDSGTKEYQTEAARVVEQAEHARVPHTLSAGYAAAGVAPSPPVHSACRGSGRSTCKAIASQVIGPVLKLNELGVHLCANACRLSEHIESNRCLASKMSIRGPMNAVFALKLVTQTVNTPCR